MCDLKLMNQNIYIGLKKKKKREFETAIDEIQWLSKCLHGNEKDTCKITLYLCLRCHGSGRKEIQVQQIIRKKKHAQNNIISVCMLTNLWIETDFFGVKSES